MAVQWATKIMPSLVFDCTDCLINEKWQCDSKWSSPKFKGPIMKYEVQLQLSPTIFVGQTGLFMVPQLTAQYLKKGLGLEIGSDKYVKCDAGRKGDPRLMGPVASAMSTRQKLRNIGWGRQEIVFSRIK